MIRKKYDKIEVKNLINFENNKFKKYDKKDFIELLKEIDAI